MVTPEHHVALVDRLVQETHPVRRLWSVRVRLTVFILLAGSAVALVVLARPRPDLVTKLHQPLFALGVLQLLIATTFAALLSFRSAVPGRTPTRIESILALILIGAAALLIGAQPMEADAAGTFLAKGWPCAARTLAVAALPWAMLLLAIRRGAPVSVASAGAYAGAASLLLATAMLRTACPLDGRLHWLTWHMATIAIGAVLSAAAGTAWLHTWRRADRPPS